MTAPVGHSALAVAAVLGASGCGVTAVEHDGKAPAVIATEPAAGAVDVSRDASVRIDISEPIDPAGLSATTFLVEGIAGRVVYAEQSATFDPDEPLPNHRVYTAIATTGITDLAGNRLAERYRWTFSTGPGACQTAPIVIDGSAGEWAGDTIHDIHASSALRFPRDDPPASDLDSSAIFLARWNAEYLYVLVSVLDDVLHSDPAAPFAFDNDSVELYLDGGHERATSYDDNDFQLTVDLDNRHDGINGGTAMFTSAVVIRDTTSDKGFQIEYAIPWSTIGVTPEAGRVIGFDLGINDEDTGDLARDSQLLWNGDDGDDWQHPSSFGDIVLLATPCAAPAGNPGAARSFVGRR